MENQIGKIVSIKEDFEIETTLGKKVINVKVGDTGFIDSKGFIHYLKGEANGKIQKLKNIELVGYCHEDIAKLIYKSLHAQFYIENMLDDSGISKDDFIDGIKEILNEIL